jgi:predicted ester cyclase
MTTSTYDEMTALCVRSIHLMTEGSREDLEQVVHPEAVNREAAAEPPAARERGPAGFWATAQWLRAAFSGLRFEIHQAASQDDLVVLHVTMSGRHAGPFVSYRPGTADVDTVMPPTGKEFAVTQTHWFRTRDGMVAEHWANRDDLAMARQAGWVPPSPGFLLRAAIAKRRVQRLSPGRM